MTIDKSKKYLGVLTKGWFVFATVFLVLFMDQAYFNLLEAKAYIYNVFALVFLATSFLLLIFGMYDANIHQLIRGFFQSFTMLDHGVCLFGISIILSTLVSDHGNEAFLGSYGWSVGSFYLVSLCMVYFVLSRHLNVDRYLLWVVVIVFAMELVLIILNGCYVDPFSLHHGLSDKDYVRYVGTIGNTNWYVGYVSLMFPFVWMATMQVKGVGKKAILRIILALATITMFTTNTEGIYLCLFAFLLLMILYSIKEKEMLLMGLENLGIMLLSGVMLVVARKAVAVVPMDGITGKVLNPVVLVMAMVVLSIVWVFLQRCSKNRYEKIKFGLKIVLLTVSGIVAAGIIFLQVSKFQDKWGHNRGRIWRVAIEAFCKQNFWHKLFGVGANCFGFPYQEITGSDWVRNAHNEYLEYLVTTGIFGVISYLGIYVSIGIDLWKSCFEKEIGKNEWLKIAAMISILSYGAQAVVNNPQALNGVLCVLVLAIYRRQMQKVVQ